MNNEIMARAMSQIDYELIAEAYEVSAKGKKRGKIIRLLATAACIAVVAVSAFSIFSGEKIEVSVGGKAISNEPVALSTLTAKRSAQEDLCIELNMEADGKIQIEAIDGEISLESSNVGEKNIEAADSFSVFWTVKNPDKSREYTLILDDKTDLTLSFDESLNKWTIFKK